MRKDFFVILEIKQVLNSNYILLGIFLSTLIEKI